MGHYRKITIDAECQKSELAEIAEGINSGIIEWPLHIRIDRFYHRKPLIEYEYKITPNPVDKGCLEQLSSLFPLVKFARNSEYEEVEAEEDYFDWYCCGRKCMSTEIDDLIETEKRKSAQRFMQSGPSHAFGLFHELQRNADGSVTASGKNIFGECNSQEWIDICAVACGDWHSVALKNDGTLVSCGSNANRQCDVRILPDTVEQISCGRYHTAILFRNGSVDVRGKLERIIEDVYLEKRTDVSSVTYPIIRAIEGPASKKRNRRIENACIGDMLELRVDEDNPSYYPVGIEVLTSKGESLGYLEDDDAAPISLIAHDLAKIKAYVNSVTPLSAQYPGARYALMTVCIEETRQNNPVIPQYHQIPYRSWRNIVEICSVHDAVIGKDIRGELYVDGDPGCSVNDMSIFLHNRFRKKED